MEMIKKGVLPKEEVFYFVCSSCGCEFKANKDECNKCSDNSDCSNYLVYHCPTCDKEVISNTTMQQKESFRKAVHKKAEQIERDMHRSFAEINRVARPHVINLADEKSLIAILEKLR